MIEGLVTSELVPVIKARESEIKTDGVLTDLTMLLVNMRARIGDLNILGNSIANKLAMGIDVMQSMRFVKIMRKAVGINVAANMTPRVSSALEASVVKNVSLIKSIPEQYFGKIEAIIHENVTQGRSSGSILKDIQELGVVTKNRAKLIARDQTAKLVSNLNMERQMQAGIIGYQWRNSKDERVRGNPSGKYPNAKYSHWNRQGKYYLWESSSKKIIAPDGKPYNNPPPDGHPGTAICCRCTADPVI